MIVFYSSEAFESNGYAIFILKDDSLLWFIVLTVWVLNILMALLTDGTGNRLEANNLI